MRATTVLAGSAGRKVLLSAALLGMVASIAGMASYATFTDTTSASQSDSSGTVTIALGAAGGADNRLTVGATDLAAGDTVDRQVKLSNAGSIDLASLTLTTSATTSSVLDTDAVDGPARWRGPNPARTPIPTRAAAPSRAWLRRGR